MKKWTLLLLSMLLTFGTLDAQNNNGFRKSGFTLRPEIGINIPLNKDGNTLNSFLFSASAKVAIGYQTGPHLFLGLIGGLGGSAENEHISSEATALFPILADARWYLIDHKYSFIIDAQGGINLYNDTNSQGDKFTNLCGIVKLNVGFAIGNFEALIGSNWMPEEMLWGLTFDVCYRFGFKKWW